MAEEMRPPKGGMATTYLGKALRPALDQAIVNSGWLHGHYVKMCVVKQLVSEGLLHRSALDNVIAEAEHRKLHPHGNAKSAKETAASGAREGASVNGESTFVPAPARGNERLRQRAAARRARRNSVVLQQGEAS